MAKKLASGTYEYKCFILSNLGYYHPDHTIV